MGTITIRVQYDNNLPYDMLQDQVQYSSKTNVDHQVHRVGHYCAFCFYLLRCRSCNY